MAKPIRLIGDLHGEWATLRAMDVSGISAIVQVGDFGFYERLLGHWTPLAVPVYALDGNHEQHPLLNHDAEAPYQVAEGLFYVPRGCVFALEGRRIGACGGAASIDYRYRTDGTDWHSALEQPTATQVERLVQAHRERPCDILVTHAIPQSECDAAIGPPPPVFGQPSDWCDPSMRTLENLLAVKGETPWFAGHFHRSCLTPAGIRILNIEEWVDWNG